MKIIKYIPNILSVCRIIASIMLLLTKPLSVLFFIIYSFCGLSDMLDGYIARKANCTSKLGSALDSLSDFILVATMALILVLRINWQSWHIVCIVTIATIRFITLAVSYIKYKTFAFLHTYANKFTGLLLFLDVFAMDFIEWSILFFIMCSIAIVSSVEELVIIINSKILNRDVKSVFVKKEVESKNI